MSLNEFKQAPWRKSHKVYLESALGVSPAPEYASSEVLLASLYRTIGFVSNNEQSVPQAGKDLDKRIQKLREKNQSPPEGAVIDVDSWHTVLHGIMESPKLPNQSTKRFLQVTPLVPGTALFSGSARLSNNSWHAGGMIRRMICLGSKNQESAEKLWKMLFEALSVTAQDDIYARWFEEEINSWGKELGQWSYVGIPDRELIGLAESDYSGINFLPARRFCKDLVSIIQAKDSLTRRQWTSLLESIIRLGAVSHAIWLCDVNSRIWGCLESTLNYGTEYNETAARAEIFPEPSQYMTYGGKALQGIKDKISGYLRARLAINATLWTLESIGKPFSGNISSSAGVAELCKHLNKHKRDLASAGANETIEDTLEQETRALLCKKGIGSNIFEFARHVLGQRQTALPLLRGYDQGYILKKSGKHPSSPWIISLGPVAALALVHCALASMGGPRSIQTLASHLSAYGISVDKHDISRNDLGHQLRMLGLVLDSPDAESGMLLLPPFNTNRAIFEGNDV